MKVLYIATECKPFSKVGGVADVAGELPAALQAQGIEIEIVTPLYEKDPGPLLRQVLESAGREPFEFSFPTKAEPHGRARVEVRYRPGDRDFPVPVSFVQNAAYFGGERYGVPYVYSDSIPYYDDALRFSFFSAACLELIRTRRPDLVHINDWPLGTLFGLMAQAGLPHKRILTIHNIGYQGNLGIDTIQDWSIAGLLEDDRIGPLFLDPHETWNSVNALRLGLELADRVNTVSPNYAREILEPEEPGRYFEGGKGLEGIARRVSAAGKLCGILNGFVYRAEADEAAFNRTLEKKAQMKQALAGEFKNPEACLFGFVGRAVEQKFKLLHETVDGKSVLEHLLDLPGINLAILATGLPEYEAFLGKIGALAPERCSVTIAFDKTKAEQISLGSDVFLMPSLFEPCGITQMESLSHATPPLVRWTGGLVDTVRPHTTPDGTGFGFDGTDREQVLRALIATVAAARDFYTSEKEAFRALQWRGFQRRFTWEAAAIETVERLYRPALNEP